MNWKWIESISLSQSWKKEKNTPFVTSLTNSTQPKNTQVQPKTNPQTPRKKWCFRSSPLPHVYRNNTMKIHHLPSASTQPSPHPPLSPSPRPIIILDLRLLQMAWKNFKKKSPNNGGVFFMVVYHDTKKFERKFTLKYLKQKSKYPSHAQLFIIAESRPRLGAAFRSADRSLRRSLLRPRLRPRSWRGGQFLGVTGRHETLGFFWWIGALIFFGYIVYTYLWEKNEYTTYIQHVGSTGGVCPEF